MSDRLSLRTRFYQIHSWTGFLLGLLSLVVFFTGAIAVFAQELGAWGARGKTQPPLLDIRVPWLSTMVDSLGGQVDPRFKDEISLSQDAGGPLTLFFHTHETDVKGKARERGVRYDLDVRDRKVLLRREGLDEEVFAPTSSSALTDFFVDLHVHLLIPPPAGLYATGIVGFGLMLLLISGVVIHRRFFRDMFRFKPGPALRLTLRSLHTVTGTWLLPYAIVLSFTGAFFGFAGALLLPAVAKVAFGGDQQKMFEVLVGHQTPPGDRKLPSTPDLDFMLADARSRSEGVFRFGALHHWGKEGARAELWVRPTQRRMAFAKFQYDGMTGAFQGEKPALGTKPSLGASLFSWMGPLHFGDFGGHLSKALWGVLGIASCVLTVSGLLIWSERRRTASMDGETNPRVQGAEAMRRITAALAAALPAATFASILAWATWYSNGTDPVRVMGTAFGLCLLAGLGATFFFRSLRTAARGILAGGGLFSILVPFAATWATGFSPWDAFSAWDAQILAMDCFFFFLGAALLFVPARMRKGPSPYGRETSKEPALLDPVEVGS